MFKGKLQVKLNSSLCLTKHQEVKAYEGTEVYLHDFGISGVEPFSYAVSVLEVDKYIYI